MIGDTTISNAQNNNLLHEGMRIAFLKPGDSGGYFSASYANTVIATFNALLNLKIVRKASTQDSPFGRFHAANENMVIELFD